MKYVKKFVKTLKSSSLIYALEEACRVLKRDVKEMYLDNVRNMSKVSEKKVNYNGVIVSPYKKIDKFIKVNLPPNRGGHVNPEEYEYSLIKGIRQLAETGDSVIVVGAGLGVSTVIASQVVGNEGTVDSYEGARNMYNMLKKTVKTNSTPSNINLHHSIVSRAVRLEGNTNGANIVHPSDLPKSNIIVMDCEGAELEIINKMNEYPEKMVVESHGNSSKILQALSGKYKILSKKPAEMPPLRANCIKDDIYVLKAKKSS